MNRLATYYSNSEPIAVIGIACRFPSSPDANSFWQNLVQGKVCSRRISRNDLKNAGVDDATLNSANFVDMAAPLDDAEFFDAAIFGYSRQETESLDPQQRIFLQTVWHALEDAGYIPAQVAHKTGVFGTARMSSYPSRQQIQTSEITRARGMQALLGNDKDYLATRVAYKLNLTGPALTVQTACSSSLVAVHLACESLRSGECSMAVAGGVAISFPQNNGYLHQPGMIFSPDGYCRPFDAEASGTFAGNGAGVVVLRRLEDALADGDPILAVIRGSAVNNDGNQKVGFTAPSTAGQRQVVLEAMLMAEVTSPEIGMVEAHGTATALGDPIEVEALRSAFAANAIAPPRCALGSVKANIGHLDTAAGIASLIKAVLAVQHGVIPPMPNFRRPNPLLDLENSCFYVPSQAEPWKEQTRTAGVSSFGIGGTNCHLIVQSLPAALKADSNSRSDQKPSGALLLSANSIDSLRRLASEYASAWNTVNPEDLAYTALHARRLDLPHRLSTALCEETPAALKLFADGKNDPLLNIGFGPPKSKMAWLFTGIGSQWSGMGQNLYAKSTAFRETIEECDMACNGRLLAPLSEILFGHRTELLDRVDHALPAIVAFEISMAAYWRSLGLKPDVVIGHSLGEYAAAAVAGFYTNEDMISLAVEGSRLLHGCDGGAMLAAVGDEQELTRLAAENHVELAVLNTKRHFVFSGNKEDISAFGKRLRELRIRTRMLQVPCAAHSSIVDSILDGYRFHTSAMHASEGEIVMISSLYGGPVDRRMLNESDFWCTHLRGPVRYRDAVDHALSEGVGIFLEMGPDANLTDIGGRDDVTSTQWIPSARRMQPDFSTLNQAYLRLYAEGFELPWQQIIDVRGRRVHAPLYPFDEQRYWWDRGQAAIDRTALKRDPGIAEGTRRATSEIEALDMEHLSAFSDVITKLHNIFVDRLLEECVGDRRDQGFTIQEVMDGGMLLPKFRQLVGRLLNACVADGYYQRLDSRYRRQRSIPLNELPSLTDTLASNSEGLTAIPEIVIRAGESLYETLSGKVDPLTILFPGGRSDAVEVVYRDFSSGRYFNRIAAGVVAGLMDDPHRPSRILEVGGGTGSTTESLLPEIARYPEVQYDFTDISPIFTRRAEQTFANYPFVTYRELDLSRDPKEQSFLAHSYDLIVAANVVHATPHIGRTLAALRSLLKPGGRVLLREITRPVRLFDFVFGPLVTPLEDEAARRGELFLSTELWSQHCSNAGFEDLQWLPGEDLETSNLGEHILIAKVPESRTNTNVIPSWMIDTGPLLGRHIDGTDIYFADWSDCQGDTVRLTERIRQAASEIKQRHNVANQPLNSISIDTLPEVLSEIRLRWISGLFGACRLEIASWDEKCTWQTFARIESGVQADARSLPLPFPVPSTHYLWRCLPLEIEPHAQCGTYEFDGPRELQQALETFGLSFAVSAPRRLIVLVEDDPHILSKKVLDALSEERRPLTFVTRGAWAVHDGESVSPVHHAIWALLRVVATEDSARSISLIDLDLTSDWNSLPLGLRAAEAAPQWVAVRNETTYSPQLISSEIEHAPLPLSAFADYRWQVVTGGFGALGRITAIWLAQQGAKRIAILATRASQERLEFIEQLRRDFGCEAEWFDCDTADLVRLGETLDQLHANGGVCGVIHAAGVLDDASHTTFTAERLRLTFAVKADAANLLQDWLEEHSSRYLLLYSSAAAALGAPGQIAHAFACGYLDGLAYASASDDATQHNPTTISIAWGTWGEVGRGTDPLLRDRLSGFGMKAITTAEGLWHLEQAVMSGSPYRLAMRIDERLHQRLANSSSLNSASLAQHAPSLTPTSESKQQEISPQSFDSIAAWLKTSVASQLRLDGPDLLTEDQDLLQLGLDSLLFLELGSEIQRAFGVRIDTENAYRDLTISAITRLILEKLPAAGDTIEAVNTFQRAPDPLHRFDPFPLTPIQHAYWLGRTDLLEFGGVSCHVLFEWDKTFEELDLEVFEKAWNALIQRHDMLRMIVDEHGQQRVLKDVAEYRLARIDLRASSRAEQQRELEFRRKELSYKVLPSDRWPMFEIVVSQLDEHRFRLHMNLDLLQFDTQSFKIMMDDLRAAYSGSALQPLQFTFRDYVQAQLEDRSSPQWQKAWVFWHDLLPELPAAPALPIKAKPQTPTQQRFTTLQGRVKIDEWTRLKDEWQRWGVTPSAALLTLYALILERYSRQPAFTLNLTFFARQPYHPDVQQIIGDFTSVLLVDFDIKRGRNLREHIEIAQAKLWERLAHRDVNGVELVRELGRRDVLGSLPAMPIVFTSMLGMNFDGKDINQTLSSFLGEPVFMFTQTPQVWLDHQVMEVDGDLVFNWFVMEGVLEDGLATAMFQEFSDLLQQLASDADRLILQQAWKPRRDLSEELFPHAPIFTTFSTGRVNLLDVEEALRLHPDIEHAHVEATIDRTRESLDITVVARNKSKDEPTVCQVTESSLQDLTQISASTQASIDEAWHYLEKKAFEGICRTLAHHGLFISEGEKHSFDSISDALRAIPTRHKLIRQWLSMLCDRGWLKLDGAQYHCIRALREAPEPTEPFPQDRWSLVLVDYLNNSIAHHGAMFRGERSPLQLLFDDQSGVTTALYSENPAMNRLNDAAAKIAISLARHSKNLKILEVGGGTASTTSHLIPQLGSKLRSYCFTDVSTLFLDGARERFGQYAQMSYALFDINQPVDFASHPVEGYDLIVANNVLHDATHLVRTLRRLRQLLVPDGHLLLIEATERDSVFQLATVGFVEGLSGFQDFRITDNKPLLELSAWRDVLKSAGFVTDLVWPQQDPSPLRQHLIVARNLSSGRLDPAELTHYLRQHFEILPVSINIHQSETLPHPWQSRPGPSPHHSKQPTVPSVVLPAPSASVKAARSAIESVWKQFLPPQQLRGDSNFFLSGGDSLIATRMIANLAKQGFRNASLQKLYTNPVLDDFCGSLVDPIKQNEDNPILLANGSSNDPVYVFHASDGDVNAYRQFAARLGREVYGLKAPAAIDKKSMSELVGDYVSAIRAHRPPLSRLVLVGWSYGAFLAAEAARQLSQIGVSAKLILLDPVNSGDFHYSDRPGLLQLLANGQKSFTLSQRYEELSSEEQLRIFTSSAISAGVIPASADIQKVEQWLAQADALLSMLKTGSIPDLRDTQCLWVSATRRPSHWSSAESEWNAIYSKATQTAIDADHWGLLSEHTHIDAIARAVTNWLESTVQAGQR